MTLEGVFESNLDRLCLTCEFRQLDFVKTPGALGPRKTGVGCLDFVGLTCSCSNAASFGPVEAVLVLPGDASTNMTPQPH